MGIPPSKIPIYQDEDDFDSYYARKGPTNLALVLFDKKYPNPTEMQLLLRIEILIQNNNYACADAAIQEIDPQKLSTACLLRFLNLVLDYYIITGATESALRIFSEWQSFAEENLTNNPAYLMKYLDNACMICALTGDIQEAVRYYDAMNEYVRNHTVLGLDFFLPQLTYIKLMELRGNRKVADIAVKHTQKDLDAVDNFTYPWERRIVITELRKARCYNPHFKDRTIR